MWPVSALDWIVCHFQHLCAAVAFCVFCSPKNAVHKCNIAVFVLFICFLPPHLSDNTNTAVREANKELQQQEEEERVKPKGRQQKTTIWSFMRETKFVAMESFFYWQAQQMDVNNLANEKRNYSTANNVKYIKYSLHKWPHCTCSLGKWWRKSLLWSVA